VGGQAMKSSATSREIVHGDDGPKLVATTEERFVCMATRSRSPGQVNEAAAAAAKRTVF